MASGDPELVRIYLNRLAGLLASSERGAHRVHALANDLATHITRPNSAASASATTNSLPDILEEFRRLFLAKNRGDEWREFQAIVDALTHLSLPDSHTRSLVYLSRLCPAETSPKSDYRLLKAGLELGLPPSTQSPFSSSPRQSVVPTNSPMAELIGSYYETLDERMLLQSLRHTLVGQDTNLLVFLQDRHGIEIPNLVNLSYTQLLTEILEPALLGISLHDFLESRTGTTISPITTAFFSCLDRHLVCYADAIEGIFREMPASLLALLDALDDEIYHLRFFNHLKNLLVELNGFEFLLEVHTFSEFGDSRVADLARRIFESISAPYYQYLEHWLVRGELIDENGEFFVSFDKDENHINDIIRYNPTRLPSFLKVDDEIFMKMFQIGKTLVFLEKYCKELDWVNDYSLRYFLFIFTEHNGLRSMKANILQVMIDSQHKEILGYFTLVVHSKYLLFSHMVSMKRVMLMESGDFINAITANGASMFGELASLLTFARLSELLVESIGLSSIKSLPPNYQKRIDARILDLSHGTIGWDVFTLAYSVPEPPLEALLNFHDQSTQYLRLFNFLWSLKHYQFLLKEHFLQFQDFHRNHMRHIKNKLKTSLGRANKWTGLRLQWLVRSLRVICLIRHRFAILIDAILNFVSFDLIENSFNVHVVRKLFETSTSRTPVLRKGAFGEATKLSILDSSFFESYDKSLLLKGLKASSSAHQNTANLTIDELTEIHATYLRSVSDCKLLKEDVRGRHSGKSFVHQIFELLELTYAFLRSSEEFGTALSNYVSILRLKSESFDFDEDWDDLHHRLNSVESYILKDLYADKFQPWLKEFANDMRAEVDLRELSKMI